ncbi:MAG TPA: RT0821/Lpp0805 family surface protein [Candidatus Sulfotelmatobacter sp.]|nr:RT0821/Lpp0805 family surface protein [Candidatus Sulfotelmatobacter sp.]
MRKSLFRGIALAMLVAVTVTGCETVQSNPKTAIGAGGGALVGGLIAGAAGANPAAIAASVIGGALLGGLVGSMLDERDKRMAAEAAARALETAPTGTSVAWNNPDTGHSGAVTPTRTYQAANGAYCREYTQSVTIDGKPEQARGTACRQADGSWKAVN